MGKGETQTNGPKYKKVNAQDFTFDCMRQEGRGRANTEDHVDAAIQATEPYIEKSNERLITAANNIIGNISAGRKTPKN